MRQRVGCVGCGEVSVNSTREQRLRRCSEEAAKSWTSWGPSGEGSPVGAGVWLEKWEGSVIVLSSVGTESG